jgi:nitrite reductase/ring-hydroxylating ferredoxin subunit
VEDFPLGASRIVEVEGRQIGVFNSGGQFYAINNACPHALAPICLGRLTGTMLPSAPGEDYVWGMDGLVLRCIWHGWEFDIRTGETVMGTDRRRLLTFPVEVEDGHVWVTIRAARTSEDGDT